jgi:hypothetical protein
MRWSSRLVDPQPLRPGPPYTTPWDSNRSPGQLTKLQARASVLWLRVVFVALVVISFLLLGAPEVWPTGVPAIAAAIGIGCYFLWRLQTFGLVLTDEAIYVMGLITRRRIPWGDIKRFTVSSGLAMQRTHTLYIALRSGKTIRVQAISASQLVNPTGTTFVHRYADMLNQRVAQHSSLPRSAPMAPKPTP